AFFKGETPAIAPAERQEEEEGLLPLMPAARPTHSSAGESAGFSLRPAPPPSVLPPEAIIEPTPLDRAGETNFTASTGSAIQLHNSYLVAESADGMVIIDQHALHERILYE